MQNVKVVAAIQIAIGTALLGFVIFFGTLHPIMIGLLLASFWMIGRGLNKQIKTLWEKPLFRWLVYLPVGWSIAWVFGYISSFIFSVSTFNKTGQVFYPWSFLFAFLSTTIWVWRKPIWKLLKQALSFLNKKTEEG